MQYLKAVLNCLIFSISTRSICLPIIDKNERIIFLGPSASLLILRLVFYTKRNFYRSTILNNSTCIWVYFCCHISNFYSRYTMYTHVRLRKRQNYNLPDTKRVDIQDG